MTRIACLTVPLFPLAARLRSEPELKDEAFAILQGNGSAATIVAATRRARKAGVRRAMTLAQARGLMPRLGARARDVECEAAASEALFEVAESFSPRVEDGGEGTVYLDLTGLELHFDPRSPEEDLGRALIEAAGRAGLPAWAGIASSKLAARVAAESPASPTVVPPGNEPDFLAPLPLWRLAPEGEVLERLRRWGLTSVGDLARLPANEAAARLGPEGQRLHERARGIDSRPLVPREPPPTFREGMELDWPLVSLEPFLFVARAALDRLTQRLETRGLACARIDLALRLDPDGHDQRSIQLPAPTRDAKTLLTLLRLDLEARSPGASVVGFRFTAHPDRPRETQLSLFGPAALSPDRLATTLARLFALLGPEGAGSPRAVDGHRPEGFALVEYAPPPQADVRPEPPPGRGLLAVRVLRPPIPIEVLTEEEEKGGQAPFSASTVAGPPESGEKGACPPLSPFSVPYEIRSTVRDGGKRPEIRGAVRVASGPWAVEEGWWREEAVERDYWDIELRRGGIYRIYRERDSGEWFADGIYD